MLFKSLLLYGLLAVKATAAASRSRHSYHSKGGVRGTSLYFEDGQDLPYLKLPYGVYQAAEYDVKRDVYRFRNVRFGADTAKENRWKEPQPPTDIDELVLGDYPKVSCPQVRMSLFENSTMEGPKAQDDSIQTEDCLFLDMQVPGKVARNPDQHSVPVVVFFFGGAYVFGAKDEYPGLMYDGARQIFQAEGDMIWVAPNYRLGALGWLAGTTMENTALPNAALYDQRAGLQWVQDNIPSIGGDKSQVTAVGQSAGAGSLLFHLVLEGGTIDPLFNQLVLLSPAFIPLYDREGDLEDTFQEFALHAGCADGSIRCLRDATAEEVIAANKLVLGNAQKGAFIFGPSVDGKLIRQLPALEFATGHYWKSLTSLILSHTNLEGAMFAIRDIDTDEKFNEFLFELFPEYTKPLVDEMIKQYPPGSYQSPHWRLASFIRDGVINCNVKWVASAYDGLRNDTLPGSYNMVYATAPFFHGADIMAHFLDDTITLPWIDVTLDSEFMKTYKDYFISFYKTGNPNSWHRPGVDDHLTWEKAEGAYSDDELISNVLQADNGYTFKNVIDRHVLTSSCDFWFEIQAAMTSLGGHCPPEGCVPSKYNPESGYRFRSQEL